MHKIIAADGSLIGSAWISRTPWRGSSGPDQGLHADDVRMQKRRSSEYTDPEISLRFTQ